MIVIEPPSSGTGAAAFTALRKPELARFLKRAQKSAGLSGEVTVLLADDARLKDLNQTFRRKNKPTDVLSFPAFENTEGIAGDLAVSVETAARQAAEHGHTLDEELRILILHGVLHLAGHDHEVDKGEMRSLESDLRAELKLPAGLIERTLLAPKKLKVIEKSTSLQDQGLPGLKETPRKRVPHVSTLRRGIKSAANATGTAKKSATKKAATKKRSAR
ncbi:rRNA maturation RNase YbeY [Terriglobus roseus]|uniref:Endoribonuclease YbeY n=1 Tax=Terriglobus roseus TaxID=392734 RepID=A0A1H4KDB8_9BACT|nr:rRNA maturation RNase YbeY [Terriglobus roseus]SEB56491.1 probable rRNA maturation factor [Terriglobus roseus]